MIEPVDRRAAERRRRRARQIRRRRIGAGVLLAVVIVAAGGLAAHLLTSGGHTSASGSTGSGPAGSTGPAGSSSGPGSSTSTGTSCTPVKAGPKIATVSFRTASGSCVSSAKLVRYRCPISEAPTLRVGTGSSVRRYLGGMYAVGARRPASARLIGQTHAIRVYATPGGTVYVAEGGHTRRWLTLPQSVAGSGKRMAYMVGDSVMLGAKPEIEEALHHHWVPIVDAVVSRSTPEGGAAIQSGPGKNAPAMALQLGTNDGGTPSLYAVNLAAVMRSVKDVPLVVWLTIGHARSYYTADDQLITSEAAKYPNMTVANWAAVVPPGGTWSDGLHLQPKGAKAMAQLISTYLDGWRSATFAPSAEACNGAVDHAVAAS